VSCAPAWLAAHLSLLHISLSCSHEILALAVSLLTWCMPHDQLLWILRGRRPEVQLLIAGRAVRGEVWCGRRGRLRSTLWNAGNLFHKERQEPRFVLHDREEDVGRFVKEKGGKVVRAWKAVIVGGCGLALGPILCDHFGGGGGREEGGQDVW
jgi:hypothetical protein